MEDAAAMSDEGHVFEQQLTRGILGFLALAVVLRLVRVLQNYPMWCDETMFAANLLDRDWSDLSRPLDYRQVSPLGFLAIEWLAVRLLGFSELALRCFPMLCGVASVPLFYRLARQILGTGTPATFLAVAVFAVSEPLVRYAGEAKPYETDFLVSLVLLCLSVSWFRAPEKTKSLWLLAAAAPAAVAISLPSLFTIGGIVVMVLHDLVRRRAPRAALAVAGFLLAVGGSVAAMAFAGQYRTRPEDRAYFLKFWAAAFPPGVSDPVGLARWLVRANTGPLFAFPQGADTRLAWLSPVLFGCFVLGAVLFARKGKNSVALLVLPMLLTLAAAALRRYPYGMSARVNLYLVPAVLILAAAGASWICSRVASRTAQRTIILAIGCLLVLFAVSRLGNDLGHPYRAPWDRTGRDFARWFWEEMPADAEVVCVRSDLGISSGPKRWAYDGADQYLCYQRIYSRRHREGGLPQWGRISERRPLRCVLVSKTPEQVPEFRKWIEEHRNMYMLKDVRSYPATRGSAVEPAISYVVCEFIPTEAAIAAGERSKLR